MVAAYVASLLLAPTRQANHALDYDSESRIPLLKMTLFRPILLAVVAFALVGYAVDCAPMASSDEAMQCCETMPCASHGAEQSQDCCKTMPSMHAPFVQAAAMHGLSFSPVSVSSLSLWRETAGIDSSVHVAAISGDSSPPPDPASSSPLRI
jgi:hypothetical protein